MRSFPVSQRHRGDECAPRGEGGGDCSDSNRGAHTVAKMGPELQRVLGLDSIQEKTAPQLTRFLPSLKKKNTATCDTYQQTEGRMYAPPVPTENHISLPLRPHPRNVCFDKQIHPPLEGAVVNVVSEELLEVPLLVRLQNLPRHGLLHAANKSTSPRLRGHANGGEGRRVGGGGGDEHAHSYVP